MKEQDEIKNPKSGDWEVGEFRPEDAEGMVKLFRSIYGEGYPIRLFYDPEAIVAANREGRYYSVVGRTASGEIIGATNLYPSAPYPGLYESGAGLILKAYRKSGMYRALMSYVFDELVPRKPQIEEIFGELVCNHLMSQKLLEPFPCIETAIEIALMPAEAYTKEQSAFSRVATLDVFRCNVPKPHRIFLPRAYEEILRRMYDRLDDRRDIALSDTPVLSEAVTRAEMKIFDFAGVARIAVQRIGSDFAACISGREVQARSKNAVVFQVSLNLAEPSVGSAVDILRKKGYFFGGVLPRWFDTDGLLLQKLDCPPDFEDIVLLSDFAKELLAFIREDRERIR